MRTILHIALTQAGVMNWAYRAFHNDSIGNQLLAALQLLDKGLVLTTVIGASRDRNHSQTFFAVHSGLIAI